MNATLLDDRPVDRVIVFDLDDTLYLERDYVASGFHAVGTWIAERLGVADFADRACKHFEAGRRGNVFNVVLADLGIRATSDFVERMVDVYRRHRPEIALAPDAKALLGSRRPEGLHFALVTDGFLTSQCNKIRALGLERSGLWPVICTDLWGRGYWKPHPRAFECIQAMFGLPPDAITYVADNPGKDFIAPNRLGWKTIQIARPDRIHKVDPHSSMQAADSSIESLAELDCAGILSLG